MKNRKTEVLSARIDAELLKKLDFVCNHLKIDKSEALRQAIHDWVNEQMWRAAPAKKFKELFLEDKHVKKRK